MYRAALIFDKARELDENSPTRPRSSGRHNLDERSQFVGTFRTPTSIPESFRQSMHLHSLRMTRVCPAFTFQTALYVSTKVSSWRQIQGLKPARFRVQFPMSEVSKVGVLHLSRITLLRINVEITSAIKFGLHRNYSGSNFWISLLLAYAK